MLIKESYKRRLQELAGIDSEYQSDRYQRQFVSKLKELFPGGVELFHQTHKDNIPSILEKGLTVENSDMNQIYFTLGEPVQRVSSSLDYGWVNTKIPVSDYGKLYPEEESYYTSDMDDLDGDEKWDTLFRNYMDMHPDLMGGDIVLTEDISPERIQVV